jgi:hypothetical protein
MAGRPGRRPKVHRDPLDEIHEENLVFQAVDAVEENTDDSDRVAEVGEEDSNRFALLGDEDLYPDPEG